MQDLKRKFMSVETKPGRSPAIFPSVMPPFSFIQEKAANLLWAGEEGVV